MIKHRQIFTWIVCLLTFGIQSVMAAEDDKYVMYSLTTTGDFPTDGNWTVPGGSFSKSGVNNSDDTEQTPKRWTMKSTGAYIQCTCNQAIAEGDVIAITGTPKSTSTSGFYIRLEGDNYADVMANIKASGKSKEQTKSYTVEAESKLIGQTTIYVMMEQQNRQWWINKIEVKTAKPIISEDSTSQEMVYSTYSNPTFALDFSDLDVKAYIITGESASQLTFKQVTKIPVNTGVLLVGTKGGKFTPKATNADTDDVTGNLLVADDGTKNADENTYILTIKGEKPGFYKSSTTRTLSKGKAHLELPNASEAKGFALDTNLFGETTGIQISRQDSENTLSSRQVNLAGQQVDSHYKGIVIQNGKKWLQK